MNDFKRALTRGLEAMPPESLLSGLAALACALAEFGFCGSTTCAA